MNNKDIYERISDLMIEELDKGIVPWHKPWIWLGCYSRFSYVKKRNEVKFYSPRNSMLLPKGGEWATIHQWNSIGGRIKKGSRSCFVVFSKGGSTYDSVPIIEENGEVVDYSLHKRNYYVLNYYNVFHIDDVEGVEKLPFTKEREARLGNGVTDIPECEKVLHDYLEREGIGYSEANVDDACYSPSLDCIQMPRRDMFRNTESFYATVFHECGHSTGADNRLGRKIRNRFGSNLYAAEELVAEMCSAFTCGRLGIDMKKTIPNTASYIASWSRKLGNAKELVGKSMSVAGEACRYIFGEHEKEE